MTWQLRHGHVLDALQALSDESVHCVVTSPPYWGLRNYKTEPQIWGGAWCGELGSEPTIQLYIEHLVEVFAEVKRVLRKDGVMYLNIGDVYSGSGKGPTGHNGIGDQNERQGFTAGPRKRSAPLNTGQATVSEDPDRRGGRGIRSGSHYNLRDMPAVLGISEKNLCLIDFRLAIALQDAGWIVRSKICWAKRATMPESTDDRDTNAWELILMCSKSNQTTFWTHRDGLPGYRTRPKPDYRWVDMSQDEEPGFVETTEEPPGWRPELLPGEEGKQHPRKRWRRVNLWRGHDYFYDQYAVKRSTADSDTHSRGPAFHTMNKTHLERADGVKNNESMMEAIWGQVTTANQRNVWEIGYDAEDWAWVESLDEAEPEQFWKLGPSPYPEAHFATFPPEIPRRAILAATSARGACAKCGAPHRRITRTTPMVVKHSNRVAVLAEQGLRTQTSGTMTQAPSSKSIGWAPTCQCDADVVPCKVLDPFLGSGTTCMVAEQLGRDSIGVELKPEYVALSEKRLAGTISQLPDFVV